MTLEALKEIEPLGNLLSKVEDLKLLAKAKVAETFPTVRRVRRQIGNFVGRLEVEFSLDAEL